MAAEDGVHRLPALDYIKAIAIAAVMVTHASPFLDDPRLTDVDRLATAFSSFHIPAFLLVSGFLSEKGVPLGWRFVARRLQRIIPPYVIASVVAYGFGFWKPNTLRRVVFGLVFGNAIGIYYYIPVLAFCMVLVPVLSRLGTRTLMVATAILVIYAEAASIDPSWRYTIDFDWSARDPFLQFHLGHFLIGVIAARRIVDLARWHARAPLLVRALAVIAMVPFVLAAATLSWSAYRPLLHTPYMLGVVALIASLTPARPAPAAIRFLSDATLPIYLYHFMLHPLLLNWSAAVMSPGARIAFMSTASLAASAAFVVVMRRLLGPERSRVLIGA